MGDVFGPGDLCSRAATAKNRLFVPRRSRYHTGNVFPRPAQARRQPDRGKFCSARQVPALSVGDQSQSQQTVRGCDAHFTRQTEGHRSDGRTLGRSVVAQRQLPAGTVPPSAKDVGDSLARVRRVTPRPSSCACDPVANGIDLSLLEHVSPIEWDNVVLYGQYILVRKLVRRRRRAKRVVLSV